MHWRTTELYIQLTTQTHWNPRQESLEINDNHSTGLPVIYERDLHCYL